MNDKQFASLIRETFRLQSVADVGVKRVDGVLITSLDSVKRTIEKLPEGSLLRQKAWRDMEPEVRDALRPYATQLGDSVTTELASEAPAIADTSVRNLKYAGAPTTTTYSMGVAKSIETALKAKVAGQTVRRMFNVDGRSRYSSVEAMMFRSVDTAVRAGIIEGMTTPQIANQIISETKKAGVRVGSTRGAKVATDIRRKATAIARTAVQDMARQVNEDVYKANKDQLGDMVWEWTSAMDGAVCAQCAPLDGKRWEQGEERPQWPLHPNCRCRDQLIDPDDPFWKQNTKVGEQYRPVKGNKPYEGPTALKTPVKINGKRYYRMKVEVTSDSPPARLADLYGKWAYSSQKSLEAAIGPARARYFRRQMDEFNKDPQQILTDMLRGEDGNTSWIPLKDLP